MVRLPLAGPLPPLDHTRKSAERLLTAMERCRSRDASFNQLYGDFMEEYSNLKHMTLVKTPLIKNSACYLSHHGVLRISSTTTKLRVVFNGSQCTPAGDSLNNTLLVGANFLPTLADVLLRWRWHHFVFIADIEKMYRQILVHPDDRDLQRILWRRQRTDDVQEYRLNTVTYGLAPAPCPRQSRNRAVTPTLHGGRVSLEEVGLKSREDPRGDTKGASTPAATPRLRGRSASDAWSTVAPPQRLLYIPPPASHDRPADQKTGVVGDSSNFRPLRLVSPSHRSCKNPHPVSMDEAIRLGLPTPQSDETLWRRLLEDLPLLEQFRLQRWLRADSQPNHVELHGFVDASERGYAAVVYLRVVSSSSTTISLLAAKSKVAPIKPVSLPRLELCAAVLVTNLTFHLCDALDLFSAPVTLWSDSRVTLQWIQGHASKWKTFVANRVSHVQTKLPEARWRHIPGRDNPADCASQGIEPRDLLNHSLWWTGSPWLAKDPAFWPQHDHATHDVEVPETRAIASHLTTTEKAEPEMLLRFSDLHRLLRVTAWCCRWRGNPPSSRAHLNLTPDELKAALLLWLRLVQAFHFSKEITALKQNQKLVKGPIMKLTPFLDDHGIIRVGDRLKHAVLSEDERHPIILPPESWMTQLLVKAHHKRTLHGGVQLTLGLLRLRYWIPRGRSIVKRTIHRYVTCVRWKAAVPQPMMSSLPTARVAPARPFLRTGVDYAGPIRVSSEPEREEVTSRTRDSSPSSSASPPRPSTWKPHRTTPPMHFSLRFGASLLVGASSSDGRRIAHIAASDEIRWRFNPPAAPHFGGLWEAAVKSTKHHLRRVLGDTTLTFEEMTFLAQEEACLNLRPLQALSDDHDDITALTPGHFLIGAPLLAVPEPSLADGSFSLLSRWKLLQRMRDHFWERWSREYVNALASRPKWLKDSASPTVGALCLVRSDTTPPTRWPLAQITRLHPGDDGVTRVVTTYHIFGACPASHQDRPPAWSRHRSTNAPGFWLHNRSKMGLDCDIVVDLTGL
ncbi:uncharacterized protein LOC112637249 [Camponotus floridanus]|uniref:uncharacterized protein LOC112637249 n=1 Tax=Camponotus floridanus TaxID=104421 RepID=UPI000DC68D21|nr:uncharacterized protein LOC112637249 [Camponotus floridanus]